MPATPATYRVGPVLKPGTSESVKGGRPVHCRFSAWSDRRRRCADCLWDRPPIRRIARYPGRRRTRGHDPS